MTVFLQELHERGLANADHTTLLLNTYTKLKDVSRLDTFIKTESHRVPLNDDPKNQEPPFDLDTAIRVCRQGGYFEQAVYLARKYKRHEDYLRIQIEDAANLKEALVYVRELGPDSVRPATSTNLSLFDLDVTLYRLSHIWLGMDGLCLLVFPTKQHNCLWNFVLGLGLLLHPKLMIDHRPL